MKINYAHFFMENFIFIKRNEQKFKIFCLYMGGQQNNFVFSDIIEKITNLKIIICK